MATSLAAHLDRLDDLAERPFTEALLTTYNVDLGFFEARALSLLRATGAAVTVIADAAVYAPDLRGIKGAGRAYHLGLVDMRAAFHPKVTVLAGPDRALVAVGSGNVTSGGWLSNDETMTIAFGDREVGIPRMVEQTAAWLRTLDQVTMGHLAREAVARTVKLLDQLASTTRVVDTGHRLVTTSVTPIIEQLPVGEVNELRLYAPFHDPAGSALAALFERFRPRFVRIAVQPGRTIIEPARLQGVAADHGVEIAWQDAGDPYRHGKVLEGVTAEHIWSLTGSPNLTGAALLRSLDSGGNCEVGVITESSESLYPGHGPGLALADVPAFRIRSAPGENGTTSARVTRLLAATLSEDSLDAELSGPAPAGAVVQISAYTDQPEHFTDLGEITEGDHDATFQAADLVPASRIRLAWAQGAGRSWGEPVPLTDPAAIVQRVRRSSGNRVNASTDWTSIFRDESVFAEWYRQLDRISREQRPAAIPTRNTDRPAGAQTIKPAEGWRTYDDDHAWAQYSEDAAARLGPGLAHLASGGLILPHLGAGPSSTATSDPVWFDKFTPDRADLDDETNAEALDEQEADEPEPSRPSVSPDDRQRKRLRSWLTRLAASTSGRAAIDRAVFTRLALIGTYLDTWEGGDAPWFEMLATATVALPGDDIPARLEPELAALAALCLYRLDQGAPADRRTGDGRRYRELLSEVLPLASQAELTRVESVARSMPTDPILSVEPEAVLEHVALANNPNPWPEIVRLIEREHPDRYVELERDGAIYIEGKFSNAQRVAAEAITHVPVGLTVVVRASPERGTETIVVRHERTLVVQSENRGRRIWKTYRLTDLITPLAIASDPETEQRARIDPPPWDRPSERAKAAFEAVDLPAGLP